MNSAWRSVLIGLDRWVRRIENALVTLLLSVLVVLASAQIVMRNVLSTSLPWGDELVRVIVLWLALIGAIAASGDGRQIHIDVLSRLVSSRHAARLDGLISTFTVIVCGFLAWHSARFVLDSRAYGDLLLGSQPAWIFQLILPIGFAVIGCRYAIRAVRGLGRQN